MFYWMNKSNQSLKVADFLVETWSHLLSIHEAIFLFDVDLVNGVALLSAGLVLDSAIRPTHHSAFTSRHLDTHTKHCSTNVLTRPCFLFLRYNHPWTTRTNT